VLAGVGLDVLALGENKLLAAASPLLQLLARLRNTANPPDAGDLSARVLLELRKFEQAARDANVPMEQLRPAHYALCASLDDVVLNTPWGTASAWAKSTLVANFHPDIAGGERFIAALGKLRQKPDAHLAVIELMYFCLSLGFMGPFRDVSGGAAALERLRGEVAAEIAAQGPAVPGDLSPEWQGVDAPFRPKRNGLPVWVALSAALAMIGAMFIASLRDLNAASDTLATQALATAPSHMPDIVRAALPMPPPPVPHEPTAVDQLQAALATEIDQKQLAVLGTDTIPVIRLPAQLLFPSGNARLSPSAITLLEHVADTLRGRPGAIAVLGFTDSTPIHTIQFPSNFQLSSARAKAVQTVIQRALGRGRHVSAEGRADADPVAPNTSAEGQAQNRRIEIVLHRLDAAR
jgi:type VI secretion system protein ImpK